MRQLTLDLPAAISRMGRDAFIVTSANARDLAMIDAWVKSDEPVLVICGASSAGKTHLASIIAHEYGAAWVERLEDREPAAHPGAIAIADNIDRVTTPDVLMETIEEAREGRRRLVLVGGGAPTDWARDLKDLVTRLEAAPRIDVSPPDEDLLREVAAKLFEDRQIIVDAKVINYAVPRLRRSLDAIYAFVEQANAQAYEAKTAVTLAVARKVVADLS